jgi:GT2 family glycosyltransferase
MAITSIVMVVWNQLEFVKQAIESLDEHTTREEYRLVVVDNNSNMETRIYLQEMFDEGVIDELITNKKNLGYIVAANQGYKLAKERYNLPYVTWVSTDILFNKYWLEKFIQTFNSNEKIGAVGPISNYVAGLQSIQHNLYGIKKEETKLLIGFFIMIKDSVIQEIGPLDESFGMGGADDLDYSIRIRNAGYKLYINREVYIHHYGSKSLLAALGNSQEKYSEWCVEHDQKFMKKWGVEIFNDFFNVGERLRVTLAVPMNSDFVHRKFARSLMALSKPGHWDYTDCPRLTIHEARNLLAQQAMKWNATHIMFVDDDMVFPAGAAEKLIEADKDIICGLAYQRRPKFLPCIYTIKPDKDGIVQIETIEGVERTGLIEIDACGGAFVLIKTEVLKKIEFPWYTWGDKSLGIYVDKGGLGEDIGFCVKAKRAGFKIWCDTDLIINHLGDAPEINDNSYREYKESGKISLIYTG